MKRKGFVGVVGRDMKEPREGRRRSNRYRRGIWSPRAWIIPLVVAVTLGLFLMAGAR